jgi:hypothetical protein
MQTHAHLGYFYPKQTAARVAALPLRPTTQGLLVAAAHSRYATGTAYHHGNNSPMATAQRKALAAWHRTGRASCGRRWAVVTAANLAGPQPRGAAHPLRVVLALLGM